MNISYLTAGAGKMYCGNCLRDNALAAAWIRQKHDVLIVPMYLPATVDEPSRLSDNKIFYGGLNVYLEQYIPLPKFVRRIFAAPALLNIAARFAGNTSPKNLGALTVSMLQGEHGKQMTELDELARFLGTQKTDVLVFSNSMLLGMHRRLKSVTGAKTLCLLNGEDTFLDALPEPFRTQAWDCIRRSIAEVDVIAAPSHYYAADMSRRYQLPQDRFTVVPPGIDCSLISGLDFASRSLGFFARLCPAKGLDILIDAFIELRRRNVDIRLKIGGGCTTSDKPFVRAMQRKIRNADLQRECEWFINVSRREKFALLQSLTLFSVPSRLNESFGLYVLESHLAGVPGIFPHRGAFPEILKQTRGGVLFEPENSLSLANAAEQLFNDEPLRKELSYSAQQAVREHFDINTTAERLIYR